MGVYYKIYRFNTIVRSRNLAMRIFVCPCCMLIFLLRKLCFWWMGCDIYMYCDECYCCVCLNCVVWRPWVWISGIKYICVCVCVCAKYDLLFFLYSYILLWSPLPVIFILLFGCGTAIFGVYWIKACYCCYSAYGRYCCYSAYAANSVLITFCYSVNSVTMILV